MVGSVSLRTRNLIIIFLLACATLVYRGTGIYYALKSPTWEAMQGYASADVKNGLLVITSVNARDASGNVTPASKAGLKANDRVLAMMNAHGVGVQIRNYNDYVAAIRSMWFGEPWTMIVLRPDGAGKEQQLRLELPAVYEKDVPATTRLIGFSAVIFLPVLAIATGLFIGLSRPEDRSAFYAGLLFLCFSYVSGVRFTAFPDRLRHVCFYIGFLMSFLLPYVFMRFFLLFPSANLIERKAPWLKHLVLAAVVLGACNTGIINYNFFHSFASYETYRDSFSLAQKIVLWAPILGLLVGLAALILSTFKSQSKSEKRRMVILFAGTLIGLLPVSVFFFFVSDGKYVPSWWLIGIVVATLLCFPLSFVYVVLKHRVFGIRVILRKGLQYALISRGFWIVEGVLVFLLLYFASKQVFVHYIPMQSPMILLSYMAVLTVLMTSLMPVINRPVMGAIDRRFFREAYNAQQVLTDLSRAVRRLAAQPDQLLQMVTEKISDSLYPDQVAVFLRDEISDPRSATRALATAKEGGSDYRCYRRTVQSRQSMGQSSSLSFEEDLILPQDALIARYLEQASRDEPEAIEVQLDDSRKSWAQALMRMDPHAGRSQEETRVLDQLNSRLIIPLATGDRILGFISLGEKMSEEPYSREDKKLLLTVAEQTTIALDYAQLIGQVAEQEKMKREIEIAKQVQAQLFPQHLPPMRSLDYLGLCEAARGVGGDYYDFLALDSNRLGIALGDISGKGISAALLMAGLQALLRSHAPHHGEHVDILIGEINRLMHSSTISGKYATFFYALYNETDSNLTYVNAGHLPPLLFRPAPETAKSRAESGPFTPFTFDSCHIMRLKTGGTVVGIFPDSEYRKETIRVQAGDILVVYSDGLTEALNGREEEFGEDRLAALVASNLHLSATELKDLILARLAEFVADAPQHDDLTLVLCKFV
jgi:sigma-B regulation protein RsbU (phosphoserine phosphatase)